MIRLLLTLAITLFFASATYAATSCSGYDDEPLPLFLKNFSGGSEIMKSGEHGCFWFGKTAPLEV